jgi:phospholipase C
MAAGPIEHVVILFKENHTYDNYFGSFPGGDGDPSLPHAPDPPASDPPHDHQSWLRRATGAVRLEYHSPDIPGYWLYAQQFTLCDRYFTDVAGPSTPNHLMVVAADSTIINNPHLLDPARMRPPWNLPSLPAALEKVGLDWRNYGGFVFNDITALNGSPKSVKASQFALDAAAGRLPAVSWVFGPSGLDEHPVGSVAKGAAWSVAQVDAVVKGGLWPRTAIFITWDDWGGWYDHVNPPEVEKWTDGTQFRYGSRVPCLVLSPYAKAKHLSHELNSHVSLIRFCEDAFGLPHLNARTQASSGMADCFDFSQTPLGPPAP